MAEWDGVSRKVIQDHGAKTTTFVTTQDVEPILEHNKVLQTIPQKSDWGRHIASIPMVIVEKWLREDGVYFPSLPQPERGKYLRRKLLDPDYRFLLTTDKAI